MGAMNKLQHTLSCLALGFALSVIGLQAWQKEIVQVDPNAEFFCSMNGIQQSARGMRVKVNLKSAQIVWMTCNSKTIQAF